MAARALLLGCALLSSRELLAEDTSGTARRAVAARERGLPHTVVEIGAGILALPAAEVCATSGEECSTGEVSLGLGIRNPHNLRLITFPDGDPAQLLAWDMDFVFGEGLG